VGEADTPSDIFRLTVPEAAQALGISPEAVLNHLSSGTLKSVKESGTVYVLLETDRPRHIGDIPSDIHAELLEELRDRVSYLERLLKEEREVRTEERKRHDTLMAQLMQRIPELEPPRGAPGAAESAPEEPEKAEPQSSAESPQELRRGQLSTRTLIAIFVVALVLLVVVVVGLVMGFGR
jgi:hypothetical protein